MRAVSMLLPFAAWLLASVTSASTATAAATSAASLVLQIGAAQQPQQQQQDTAQVQHQLFLAALPPWTYATLEAGNGRLVVSAPVTASGRLVFHNVTPGVSYLGEVHCATHIFAPLRVDVPAEGAGDGTDVSVTETFRGNDWANRGPALPRLAQPGPPTFAIAPFSLQPKNFYATRESFSVLTLLKNPMILMGGVGLLLMVGMPYLMENMDPEMRAEYEERQKSNPMNSLLNGGGSGGPAAGGFDMAAFLAGSSTTTNSGSGSSGGGGGGGGGKSNNRNQGGRR